MLLGRGPQFEEPGFRRSQVSSALDSAALVLTSVPPPGPPPALQPAAVLFPSPQEIRQEGLVLC